MAKSYLVKWDSVPDYDDWGPDSWWECIEWKSWFYALKTHFGRDTAKSIWVYGWNKQGFGSGGLDCRSFDSEFRSFLKKEDLEDAAGANILGSAFDILKGIETAAVGASKTLKYVAPALIIGITLTVLFLLYTIAKTGKLPLGIKLK